MSAEITLSPVGAAHASAVTALHDAAFGGPAESVLVARMTTEGDALLSLGAFAGETLLGHAFWFRIQLETETGVAPVAGLGPMGVRPDAQRRGIGAALIRDGHERLSAQGEKLVLVLGHVGYYPRFGFSAALAQRIEAPWRGPAFMAAPLTVTAPLAGRAHYPKAFAT